jgi:hypothetical protein
MVRRADDPLANESSVSIRQLTRSPRPIRSTPKVTVTRTQEPDGTPSSATDAWPETPSGAPVRELHVYVVPLVQTFQDREVVLWNSGPILAWEPAKALQEAVVRLMRHSEPIPVLLGGSKPRLVLQRIHAAS